MATDHSMSDESSKPTPDPTELTTQASTLAKESADKVDELRDQSLQRQFELRDRAVDDAIENLVRRMDRGRKSDRRLAGAEHRVLHEQIKANHRIAEIRETHRTELKADLERSLASAAVESDKRVQAALAAAEKARDQQTIASELATTKAEASAKEQLKQQGETFTAGIASLATGLGDVKSAMAELRAEKRGGQEQVVVGRDNAADLKPLVDAIALLATGQSEGTGRHRQVEDSRSSQTLRIGAIALFTSFLIGIAGLVIAITLRTTPSSSGTQTGLPPCSTATAGTACVTTK
jgi:hypothetical protein